MYYKENRLPNMHWTDIDTVLLDMDGTLLDLHYDSHFWLEHLPQTVAAQTGQPVAQIKANMMAHYEQVSGQIQWYCCLLYTSPSPRD